MKRETKAFLVGPAIGIFFIIAILEFLAVVHYSVDRMYGNSSHDFVSYVKWLLITSVPTGAIGLVIAYTCTFVFGIFYIKLLRKAGHLNLKNTLIGAFVCGFTIGFFLGGLIDVVLEIPKILTTILFGICGMIVAYSIWRIGFRESEK